MIMIMIIDSNRIDLQGLEDTGITLMCEMQM